MSETSLEMISATVGQLPGNFKKVKVPAPATVQSVVSQAEYNPAGFEIRVNNMVATLQSPVPDGAFVVLVQPVKGNCD